MSENDPLPDVPTPPVLRQASVGSACRDCFRNVCQSIVFVRVEVLTGLCRVVIQIKMDVEFVGVSELCFWIVFV